MQKLHIFKHSKVGIRLAFDGNDKKRSRSIIVIVVVVVVIVVIVGGIGTDKKTSQTIIGSPP